MKNLMKENDNKLKNAIKAKYIPVSIETIGEKFEQDARRYKRYLGNDSRVVLV